jgi:hypothetical protein
MVVAGIVLVRVATSLPQPTHRLRDVDRVVLVARADAQLPDLARSLGEARSVDSIADLDTVLGADTRVIVVDRSAITDGASGSLRGLYLRGMPLMAVNASVADLYRLTGQDEELRAVDPQFAAETLARSSCEGECARNTFWSLTWRSCAGDQGGVTNGPYVPGHASAREFDAFLTRQIRLGPPCSTSREQASEN